MMTRSTIAAGLCFTILLCATRAAYAEQYTVSPRATDATRSAVAAGRPPEHGFPEIVEIHISTEQVRPGRYVDGEVRTSPNVGYVEARVKNYNVALDRTGMGRFALHYKTPLLPPFLVGHWTLQIIARSVDGVEVKRTLPVVYRY